MTKEHTLAELQTKATVVPIKAAMSKADKLHRLADVLERLRDQPVAMFHLLERRDPLSLETYHVPMSPFDIAAADPVLKEAGLTSPAAGPAMRFFELTMHEARAFSCDCGGVLTSATMAKTVRAIAGRQSGSSPMPAAPQPGFDPALAICMAIMAVGLPLCLSAMMFASM